MMKRTLRDPQSCPELARYLFGAIMVCLRCGHCCKRLMVIIVNDPEKGIREDNLVCHEGYGPCKHLQGSVPGEYRCILHNRSWYKQTPCFSHTQIESSPENPCRMGVYVLAQPALDR